MNALISDGAAAAGRVFPSTKVFTPILTSPGAPRFPQLPERF
jgi:hypothetical protein